MVQIDPIFQNADTQKDMVLRPSLWNRVEVKLDKKRRRQSIWRRLSMVAAFAAIVIVSTIFWPFDTASSYQLEDFGSDYEVFISRAEVADLYRYYQLNQSEDLNG